MSDTPPRPSKSDWKERIAPHLSQSLQTVSDKITRTDAVQSWLHDASMAAAEGLGHMTGMQGEMHGYVRMMDDLEDTLPELLDAVHELTDGCGTVDLHWRPLQPNFSRLYVDFGRDYTVKVFVSLGDCTAEAARDAIATVTDALPKGSPFPNRPNAVTGFVARKGRGVGVRVKEHLRDDQQNTYRSITLLPDQESPVKDLTTSEAERSLRAALCSDETGS